MRLYGLKTKDEVKAVAQRWMAEIAELREKYPLLVVMRDNAEENKSKELSDYFTSMGVESYYSTANEPRQDGLAESAVKSVMMLAKGGMAGSGLACSYWFSAATNGKDCRNVTHKERIKYTPWGLLYNKKGTYPNSDLLVVGAVSPSRPTGSDGEMHLNKVWREKGKTALKSC
jgi:hypothetical protein